MTPETSPARPSRRYSTFVGIAFLVLVVVATLNTIRTEGGETLDAGTPLPEFAVPDARNGPLDRDAAIFQDDCSTSENPCPADAKRTPACEIDASGAIRVCDLFERPLVLSFWFTRGASCLPTQDSVDRVASRYRGRVNFLSIDVRDDPEDVQQIVADHGWRLPVGYDRDGAVSNLYRVGGCPTLIFAYPGGIVGFEKVGEISEADIGEAVRRLLRESRARAATPR